MSFEPNLAAGRGTCEVPFQIPRDGVRRRVLLHEFTDEELRSIASAHEDPVTGWRWARELASRLWITRLPAPAQTQLDRIEQKMDWLKSLVVADYLKTRGGDSVLDELVRQWPGDSSTWGAARSGTERTGS